jgi:hypothetical protein
MKRGGMRPINQLKHSDDEQRTKQPSSADTAMFYT